MTTNVLSWSKAPDFCVGSENEDGSHRRDQSGWPFSVYRSAASIGGTDIVLCHGIQHQVDAATIAALLNSKHKPSTRTIINLMHAEPEAAGPSRTG